MLGNRPADFVLIARLINGEPADGTALAQALFNQIRDRATAIRDLSAETNICASETVGSR